MNDLTRLGPDLYWVIGAWLLAMASWMCIADRATCLQRGLCATTFMLALTTLAEGAALSVVLLLMLWVVLATLLRWLGLDLASIDAAPQPGDARSPTERRTGRAQSSG